MNLNIKIFGIFFIFNYSKQACGDDLLRKTCSYEIKLNEKLGLGDGVAMSFGESFLLISFMTFPKANIMSNLTQN
ncbi:hypothetical protein BpHYR1_044228 [Brachionus plicatilis]|uniref:Uncharacterized protein n=1 Tax=Brachionus plicatilis TaxID=10195 RepID=A0A3M7SVX8_BRAPC|nr:hypothetical protein BpHYR1_044228 [Brachionus plicatilis]